MIEPPKANKKTDESETKKNYQEILDLKDYWHKSWSTCKCPVQSM